MQYEDFRREYLAGGLGRDMLQDCPFAQFQIWLDQAVEGGVKDPTAMVLATVNPDGELWQRIVLLKGFSVEGLVFYSNYTSAKAVAMDAEPRVSLHFPWNALDRQVTFSGRVEKTSAEDSARYFASRPRESQLAAWASFQSQPVASRTELEARMEDLSSQFGSDEIPAPEFWGGYKMAPERVEFWQGGAHRLHDRFVYRAAPEGGWRIEQLQP